MDAEEIQKRLPQLSRPSFRRVVALILRKVLNLESINVDAGGDGGSDWMVFQQDGQRLRLAIQDTVQEQGWRKKALDDAATAKEKLGVNRYLFFTCRSHQQSTVVQLEEEIVRQTGLTCRVFEGRQISELIVERGLESDFLGTIGESVSGKPPEMPEMCLCAYGNLSADRRNHRDEVYRDTLLVACYEAGRPVQQNWVVDAAIEFMGTTQMQRPLLEKQVEHLMSKGHLRKLNDGTLELNPNTRKRLNESEQLYLTDWAALESAQMQAMKARGASMPWTTDDSRQAAVFVTRMFLRQQFDLLRHARVDNRQKLGAVSNVRGIAVLRGLACAIHAEGVEQGLREAAILR